jgi:hypothetical protein
VQRDDIGAPKIASFSWNNFVIFGACQKSKAQFDRNDDDDVPRDGTTVPKT